MEGGVLIARAKRFEPKACVFTVKLGWLANNSDVDDGETCEILIRSIDDR